MAALVLGRPNPRLRRSSTAPTALTALVRFSASFLAPFVVRLIVCFLVCVSSAITLRCSDSLALGCLMLDYSYAPLFRLRLLWRLAVPALNTLLLRCSDTPASYSPIRFSGAWLTTPLVLWSTVLGCLWRSPALDGSNTRPLRHTPLGVLQQAPLLSTSRSALPRSTSSALGLSCAGLFLPSTLSDALLRPVPVLGAWLFHFDLFVLPCSLIESLIDVVY